VAVGALIVDHQGAGGPVAAGVRGSLIASSLQTLREHGYFDRYLAQLPAPHRDHILYCLASSWLPIEVAMAHYCACEAMGLSESELLTIGESVSQRIMGTFLGTMLRSSRSVGAALSPWIPLRQYGRVCDRLLSGGVHRVREMGPKDAEIETSGVSMFRYRYFRVATLGIVSGAAGIFSKRCYAKELSGSDSGRIRVSLRWV
jgi:hypothetical protein